MFALSSFPWVPQPEDNAIQGYIGFALNVLASTRARNRTQSEAETRSSVVDENHESNVAGGVANKVVRRSKEDGLGS